MPGWTRHGELQQNGGLGATQNPGLGASLPPPPPTASSLKLSLLLMIAVAVTLPRSPEPVARPHRYFTYNSLGALLPPAPTGEPLLKLGRQAFLGGSSVVARLLLKPVAISFCLSSFLKRSVLPRVRGVPFSCDCILRRLRGCFQRSSREVTRDSVWRINYTIRPLRGKGNDR